MWWFALILFLNFMVPTRILYDDLGFSIFGFRATPLDALLFLGPLLALLPGWGGSSMPVARVHPALKAAILLFAIGFAVAAVMGAMQPTFAWQPKWYFAPLRNFLIMPIAAVMGYQVLRRPAQCKTVVWLIFAGSLMAAAATALTSGQSAAGLAETATRSFNTLRDSQAQASGEAGLLAACLLVFCFVARIRLMPLPLALSCLGISGLGMFFLMHRSTWLMCALVLMFAALYLWRAERMRSMMISAVLAPSLLICVVAGVWVMQQRTGRDFAGWVTQRIASLLPNDEMSTDHRAWDTRLPGLQFDLDIWMRNPLLGGGFGIHEAHAMRTGKMTSLRHTPWTSTLAESGFLGLAAFAVTVGALMVVGTRLARTGPDVWMMLMGVLGACVGFSAFILGWLTLSWNMPRQAVILGLFLGLVLRCRDLAVAAHEPMPREASTHESQMQWSGPAWGLGEHL